MTIKFSNSAVRWTVAAALICFAPAAWAQSSQAHSASQPNSAVAVPASIKVLGTVQWFDTKVDLRAGEKIRLTATGSIKYPPDKKHPDGRTFGPEGLPRAYEDLIHQYPVSDAGHGALIARLGESDSGQPFLVGESKEFVAPVAGRLFLGINQAVKNAADAAGDFHVKIVVLDPGLSTTEAANAGGPPDAPINAVTPGLLERVPRRVTDPQGLPGDMVNVLIVGSEEELVQVFTTAGWVKVDSGVQNTVITAIFDSLEKKDYLTMPMSTLYLFKRPQDYGFAHAEPVRVAMSRNHLRAWKSPYEVEGRPLWCIAATHDIGFERDQRNNGVTHKIDPSIDGEREYVNATLTGTGLVVARNHVTPADALTEANTATGGTFHSDGRILVLVMKDTPTAAK